MSDRKLRAWQDAGLIDAATAARIQAWEAAHARPLVLWAVIGIGALAIALGLISVVAANWDAIPGQVRLAIHMLLLAGLAGWIAWREPGLSAHHPMAHEAAVFVAGALGLTFFGHLGQVYQTSSPLWQPVGLWLLLFAPLLLGRGLSALTAAMVFAGCLLTVWDYAFDSDGLSGSAMAEVLRVTLAACAPVLLAGGAAWMRHHSARDEFWRRLAQLALAYAIFGASAVAVAAGYERFPSHDENGHALVSALVASAIGGISAGLLYRANSSPGGRCAAAIMAAAAAMPLVGYGLSGDEAMGALLFMALWAGIGAAALRAGWRGLFQLAVGVIAVRLIVLSFELAGDLLTSGAGLIASGMLILGIAWGAVRVSRRFAPPAQVQP